MPGVSIDLDRVQTNIVLFHLKDGQSAPRVVDGLKQRGVLAGNIGPHAIRLVTHHDVSRAQCEDAAHRIRKELAGV
jgi:threonine aldolase